MTSKTKKAKHKKKTKHALREDHTDSVVQLSTTTLQSAFIAPHIDHLFSLLFQYIKNGTLIQQITPKINIDDKFKLDEMHLLKNENMQSSTHDNTLNTEYSDN